jgi:hypothetical protein
MKVRTVCGALVMTLLVVGCDTSSGPAAPSAGSVPPAAAPAQPAKPEKVVRHKGGTDVQPGTKPMGTQ